MKNIFTICLTVALSCFMITGCTNQEKQDIETIKIGIIEPLSGPNANFGEDAIHVYQYLTEEFNNTHTDKQIKLIIEDGKCEWWAAASAAQKLISMDDVKLIVASFCSPEVITAWQIAQNNWVMLLSAVASSPELENIWEYVVRYYNDAKTTKKLVEYLNQNNAKKIFILAENDSYGQGRVSWIENQFGWDIEKIVFPTSEQNFDLIAKQIKDKIDDIDYFVFVSTSDPVTINAFEALYNEWVIENLQWKLIGSEMMTTNTVIDTLDEKLNGVKIVQLMNFSSMWSKAAEFVNKIQEKYTVTSDPYLTVLEWETFLTALDAITNKWNNSELIKNYIYSFNANNLRDGLFWWYYFSSEREAVGLEYLIYEIQNWELIEEK